MVIHAVQIAAKLRGPFAGLSELAADLHGALAECDFSPILFCPGSGQVGVVDALFIAG